jgi:hypothetical protein
VGDEDVVAGGGVEGEFGDGFAVGVFADVAGAVFADFDACYSSFPREKGIWTLTR